ncbi:TolB family protein [Phytomonospora endophytica]|uniref:WD40 repeat protein n=1 Tax=Phytomonospora endophytica TaxID=714109 RepID=A0A841G6V4_9ACTN|nr:hypothetical protein [Phytomonospora endophytica]MBB6039800.1 hypothetical protein [Phytomonospora endophytica]GIG70345.1 hypothetical protein Pen01_66400 [Phytomonospora endophytica]
MTLKSLGEGLRDLAGAVETVDMRERAIAASQRLRARRITTGVVGAVAVLLVGLLGFNAVWTDRAAPEDIPAADRPVEVPALPAPVTVAGVAENLSGDFYYLAPSSLDSGDPQSETQSLLRWDGDGALEVVAEGLPITGTVNVSPDGRYLSFVRTGQLVLRDLASGREWQIMAVPDAQLCAPPVWAPDGRRLLVHRGNPGDGGPVGFYDITTGTFTQIGDVPGCHLRVWQDDAGRDMLNYTSYDDQRQMTNLREVDTPEPQAGYDWGVFPGTWIRQPYSVSPDGDLMCVDTLLDQTFPGDMTDTRGDFCTTIVALDTDSRDGTAVSEIPIEGGGVSGLSAVQQAVMFRDSFVARTSLASGSTVLRLYSDKGEELEELTEPMWETDPVLIGYVP